MNILYLSWTDMGDGNWHRAEAIRHIYGDEHSVILASVNEKSKRDLEWNIEEPDKDLLKWADIIHISDTSLISMGVDEEEKPIVWEFRGGFLRMAGRFIFNAQLDTLSSFIKGTRKFPLCILTTDELGRFAPRYYFIPMAYPTHLWKTCDSWPELSNPIRLVHTPSRRDYKDTDMFIESVSDLDVEVIMLEGESYEASLDAKRHSDILYGQMRPGDIGASENEALCFGLATISRMQPISRVNRPKCPVLSPNSEEELKATIKFLLDNPKDLIDIKKKSREWAEWFISYESVAPRQIHLYNHLVNGDDPYWHKKFSDIWKKAAIEEQNIYEFIDVSKLRW